jgi:hypothetical protein
MLFIWNLDGFHIVTSVIIKQGKILIGNIGQKKNGNRRKGRGGGKNGKRKSFRKRRIEEEKLMHTEKPAAGVCDEVTRTDGRGDESISRGRTREGERRERGLMMMGTETRKSHPRDGHSPKSTQFILPS